MAAEVEFAPKAKAQLQSFKEQGWDQLPICMAKPSIPSVMIQSDWAHQMTLQ